MFFLTYLVSVQLDSGHSRVGDPLTLRGARSPSIGTNPSSWLRFVVHGLCMLQEIAGYRLWVRLTLHGISVHGLCMLQITNANHLCDQSPRRPCMRRPMTTYRLQIKWLSPHL